MEAVYHVHGPNEFYFETTKSAEASRVACEKADETGQLIVVFMYWGNQRKTKHYFPDARKYDLSKVPGYHPGVVDHAALFRS